MKRLLSKSIGYLLHVVVGMKNYISNWISLNGSDVKVGKNLSIKGEIIIKNRGKIILGNNVLINNHSRYNPVGLPHEAILATLNSQAIIEIGDRVGISGASIVAAQKVVIGDNVLIGGGVGIWDTDFHPVSLQQRLIDQTSEAKSSPIYISDGAFIGARVIILKGVSIGKGVVVAAGTLVNSDIPDYHIAYGNPMKFKKNEGTV